MNNEAEYEMLDMLIEYCTDDELKQLEREAIYAIGLIQTEKDRRKRENVDN